ncbi:30S ribosomal protein S20 [Candidatus Saccharibacteria bacterium]|nr:30S ribosomal protein S20 [Candidatus Saccharibacteria bacterium]
MPIIKSAIKRAKQATVRRERNVATKKDVKSAVKTFHAKPTAKTLAAAQSEIDTAVKKNVLNKNTAARRKSALAKVAKEAGVKLDAAKKAPAAKPAATKAPAKKPATKTAAKPASAKKPAAKATAKTTATPKKASTAKKPAAKK